MPILNNLNAIVLSRMMQSLKIAIKLSKNIFNFNKSNLIEISLTKQESSNNLLDPIRLSVQWTNFWTQMDDH